MIVGKYLQIAFLGSALASYAAAEEAKQLRTGGDRKLGHKKNRAKIDASGYGYVPAPPVDNSVTPDPTKSPTLSPTFSPTLSPVWKG